MKSIFLTILSVIIFMCLATQAKAINPEKMTVENQALNVDNTYGQEEVHFPLASGAARAARRVYWWSRPKVVVPVPRPYYERPVPPYPYYERPLPPPVPRPLPPLVPRYYIPAPYYYYYYYPMPIYRE